MSHRDYVADRVQREPMFATELQAAAAELVLGEALLRSRHEQGLSLAELAGRTGISEERLASIEAGDSITVPELLWLVHALDAAFSIAPGFQVAPITFSSQRAGTAPDDAQGRLTKLRKRAS